MPLTRSLYDAGPPPPCPARMNLAAYVLRNADKNPAATALTILSGPDRGDWSYDRLARAVRGVAAGLRSMGFAPGDRLLMRMGNRVDFPITFLGAIHAGLIPAPTAAQLTTAEITPVTDALRPAATVIDDGIDLPKSGAGHILKATDLRKLWDGPGLPAHDSAADDPAYIVFTSGSSGAPTGVMHAHRAIWARRMMWAGWYDLRPDDRMFHAGAFNWTFTLGTGLMDPWSIGATAIIPGEAVSRGDLPTAIRKSEATIFAAAPGVYRQILKSESIGPIPCLRHGLSAGEKMPVSIHADWESATGTQVYEALGMSEVSTYLSTNPLTGPRPEIAGYPQPGRRVAVVDPASGDIQGIKTAGTLAVSRRDPGLMLGYLDQPELFRDRCRGEWFLTGDVVSMDTDGAVTYLGRDDDMLNAGGFRVSPVEVEAAVTSFPGVSEAAAVAANVRADVSVIAVAFTARTPIDLDALSGHCQDRLARFKQPRVLRQVAALPRSANGKVLRKALRNSFLVEDDQA